MENDVTGSRGRRSAATVLAIGFRRFCAARNALSAVGEPGPE